MNTRYAIIRIYNDRGYDTDTRIVYSEAELRSTLASLREQGYAAMSTRRWRMAYDVQ